MSRSILIVTVEVTLVSPFLTSACATSVRGYPPAACASAPRHNRDAEAVSASHRFIEPARCGDTLSNRLRLLIAPRLTAIPLPGRRAARARAMVDFVTGIRRRPAWTDDISQTPADIGAPSLRRRSEISGGRGRRRAGRQSSYGSARRRVQRCQ